MDKQYHGIAIPLLPQVGQTYSARTADVPSEYQGPLTVVGLAFLDGYWLVLTQMPWDQDIPMGVWFRQDWFMANFRREEA